MDFVDTFSNLASIREGMTMDYDEVRDVFDRCLTKMEALGPQFAMSRFRTDNHKLKVKFTINLAGILGTTVLGHCALSIDSQDTLQLLVEINKLIYNHKLIPLLENNIYHEMCHAFQRLDAIDAGLYEITPEHEVKIIGSDEMQDYYNADAGHSAAWYKYVNVINERIKPTIPITATADEEVFKLFLDESDDDVTAEIIGHAENCPVKDDASIRFYEDSVAQTIENDDELARLLLAISAGSCKCNGCGKKLSIKFYSDKLKHDVAGTLLQLSFEHMMAMRYGERDDE